MRFTTKPGGKGNGDQKLLVETDGREVVLISDVWYMLDHLRKNEDRINGDKIKANNRHFLVEGTVRLVRGDLDLKTACDIYLRRYGAKVPSYKKLHKTQTTLDSFVKDPLSLGAFIRYQADVACSVKN